MQFTYAKRQLSLRKEFREQFNKENNSIKLLEFFITINFECELFTLKIYLKEVKFRTSNKSD